MAALEFWYEFGSTYSYPAAMRIERLAQEAGVSVRYRPFLLGPILKDQGLNNSPFNIFAAKGRYMWRDLARVCDAEGLALKLPPVRFPQNGLKAARLALVGEGEGWTPALHPRRVRRQLRRAERYQRRGHARRASSRRLASMRTPLSLRQIRLPSRTGSSSRPRRPRGAAFSGRRPSPSAMSCSGATTASRRRSPGQSAIKLGSRAGRWRAA